MKSFSKCLIFASIIFAECSCKKYLDIVPNNVGTLDYAFRNRNEAENYLFSCYSQMQRIDESWNPGFTISTEIIYPNNLMGDGTNLNGFNLIRGNQNTSSPRLDYWSGSDGSAPYFQGIRICNTMLENIDQPIDLTESEKLRWIAEVKFLKAYYHYFLMRMYGPIPITDKNLPINATTEQTRVKRNSLDSVVNYIVSLLDEATPNLPPAIQNAAKELGRATRPMALTLKAEVLATAASPLFNGNPDYANFKGKDRLALFPSEYDQTKWDKATIACKAAIAECEGDGIRLFTNFTPPANLPLNLSDSLKQLLKLQSVITEKWDINPELIWAMNSTFYFQGWASPRLTAKSLLIPWGSPSTFAVPISTTELFYTNNGLPIDEDKTWDYARRFELQTGDDANRFYIKKDEVTVKAHFSREPRFYSSIGFDRGIWYGNGNIDQNNPFFIRTRGRSEYAGPKDQTSLNVTGYWPKKLVHYQSVWNENVNRVAFHMPMMRLAGLYLLYAEALNESKGPVDEVFTYLDRVRERAGLKGVKDSWTNNAKPSVANKFSTKEGLRKIIHQERRIELCFEAQSGWDLRRWKELQDVLSKPIQGWSINEAQASNFYRPQTVVVPIFRQRDYLWPIRDYDLLVNPNLVQNPYW